MAETAHCSKKKPLSKAAQKYKPKHSLLSLPPEIRNMIWEYVVSPYEKCEYEQRYRWVRRRYVRPPPVIKIECQALKISSPAFRDRLQFVRTCRQIYAETFQMFYARNKLVFPLDNTEASQTKLLTFLLRMNPAVRLLAQEDATWRIWNESDDWDERRIRWYHEGPLEMFFQQIGSLGWCEKSVHIEMRRNTGGDRLEKELGPIHGANGSRAYQDPRKRYIFQLLAKHLSPETLREPLIMHAWSLLVRPNRDNIIYFVPEPVFKGLFVAALIFWLGSAGFWVAPKEELHLWQLLNPKNLVIVPLLTMTLYFMGFLAFLMIWLFIRLVGLCYGMVNRVLGIVWRYGRTLWLALKDGYHNVPEERGIHPERLNYAAAST